MRLFLGIDGGGSRTTALVGDERGRVVGRGVAGAANADREQFESALREALHAAGFSDARFEAACLGLSGGTDFGRDDLAQQIISADRYLLTHDAAIALTGALAGEPGVIVIAGTGSIASGKNEAGQIARAGGWGFAFGDEGSAFDIVRQALRAGLRFEEGWGPSTAIRDVLLEATQARDANDLLHRFYSGGVSRSAVASYAPLIDQTALAGDVVARQILNQAAQSLAAIAAAVRLQLFKEEDSVMVAYSGGVLQSAMLLDRFRTLVELHDGNRVIAPRFIPAEGALIEAYRAAGIIELPQTS
jgi:N-acetylglucosamine kinase-like BadF-type ATPase